MTQSPDIYKESQELPGELPGILMGAPTSLDDLYIRHGNRNNLDPLLLKAVAMVESNENPSAKNPSDPSFGLMQILCTDDGKGGCANKLNVNDWPPMSRDLLYDPDYNLNIAAQILAWNISMYGFKKGIAVYNSWSARNDPPEGPFVNQAYVNKVMANYAVLTSVLF